MHSKDNAINWTNEAIPLKGGAGLLEWIDRCYLHSTFASFSLLRTFGRNSHVMYVHRNGTARLADLQSEHKQGDAENRESKLNAVNCRQLLFAFLPGSEPDILVPVWCRAM